MSNTIVRLLLSVIALAATPAVFGGAFIVVYEILGIRGRDEPIMLSCLVTCAFVFAAWPAIWWGQVSWKGWRVAMTAALAAGDIVVAAIPGAVFGAATRSMAVGFVTAGIVWSLVWLVGTVLIWRETQAEHAARLRRLGVEGVACPKCGYNMTGLRQAECPECGAQYTLDELFAAVREDTKAIPER
jgi:hypothetical protein